MIIKLEKIFGSDLPLLVKLYEIWSVDSHGNHENCCHQPLDFEGKMHQIRFRLGLHPRPRWGSSQRSPRHPSWILGVLLLREGRGRGGNRAGGWRGRGEGREGGEKEEGKGLLPRWIKNPGYGTDCAICPEFYHGGFTRYTYRVTWRQTSIKYRLKNSTKNRSAVPQAIKLSLSVTLIRQIIVRLK